MSKNRMLCAAWLLLCACTALAADGDLPPSVWTALQRAQIPESAIGVYVQRVGEGSPLLTVHAERSMNPASTMKLVTTYAALELLGPAYTWKTTVSSNAPQVGGVLEGDLYLRGSGDPKLVVESFWLMLRQLRNRGIRTIRGDLVLDRSLFDAAAFDPAAFDGEPSKPYNVGPDALLLNFKSITLRFVPDETKREIRVSSEPVLDGFDIGAVAYAEGPCGDWRARAVPDFSRSDRITFAGAYAASCGEQTWNVAVMDHRQYVAALFRSLWSELGGSLGGSVRDGIVPPDARTLVDHESPSLSEVVRDINKYSNNVMAREVFLALGTDGSRAPTSVERAQRAVRAFYLGKNLLMPELVLENGSGLSRRERISPQSMGRILQAAWGSPVMPELISSLPLVGFDGTMKRRLNQRSVAGQAHVKTGSLADVRAVAGYVLTASGRYCVVVVIVNHVNASGAGAAQDALLQWVYENG